MANPSLQIGNSNWAIKEDNLLGYSTAGTRFVPQPITMTRASAGTRVNSSGLVETVELLGSEKIVNGDFATDSDWNKGTGWSISGGSATLSVQAGSSSLSSSNMTVTVGKIYKVTVNVSATSTGFRLYDALGVVSYGLSLGENVFYRTPSSSIYTVTPLGLAGSSGTISNVSVKEYTANNLARVDYDGTASSLLVEPERTNLIPYSEAFNSWNTIQFVTVAEDTSETTSPSGNNTASKITINSASTVRRLFEVISTSSGSDYTFTLYAKKGTTDFIRVYFSSSIIDISFDLTNGTKTVSSGTGSIESVGNDWYRIQGTGTSSLTTEVPQIQLSNSASVNDYLYIWGAQTEEGSYGTSYIPNFGTALGVTRVQDQYSKTGISNLINSEEGVLFLEVALLDSSDFNWWLSVTDGTSTNSVAFVFESTGYTTARLDNASGNQAYLSYAGDYSQNRKLAFKWKASDFALWIDGYEVVTTSSGSTFASGVLNSLQFSHGSGSNTFNGKVKQLQIYKTTDIDLAALTS